MRTTKTVYIGVGIYSTGAFFNHSCRPDVARYFLGKTLVIASSRTVKKGQMVAENYGPIFTHKGRADRQRSLKGRYWFDCACPACENDWPSYDAMPDMLTVLTCCPHCRGSVQVLTSNTSYVRCLKCKKQSSMDAVRRPVDELNALYQTAMRAMDEGKIDKAVELLSLFIETVEALLIDDQPIRQLLLAQEALRLCLVTYGTTYDAAKTPSLKVVAQQTKS